MIRISVDRNVDIRESDADVSHALTVTKASSVSRRRGKRAFDLMVLFVSHVVLLPLLLLLWVFIPLAIWLEDRGPVFYVQRRVGKDGRVFRLFKFRSMIRDAEKRTGPVLASEGDPRITRVGRFLRATALDELPQTINLWQGDLSIVGPRPERPELVAVFGKELPQFFQRLEVVPGLTGLAQVYGRYSSLPRQKLHYDRIYIRNQSIWLDVKIIFLSVLVTLRGSWQAQDKHLKHWRKRSPVVHRSSRQ